MVKSSTWDVVVHALLCNGQSDWCVVQKSARRSFLIGGNCLVLGGGDQKEDLGDEQELG